MPRNETIANLSARIGANTRDFDSAMQRTQKRFNKFSSAITNVGRNISIGITAPLAIFARESVKAFDQQAKAVAQVEAALESTGQVAGRTIDQLTTQATALQKNTIFGDEEILKGVTAQLLTFTNIAGTEFDRTQQAALDLATRLDGDLKSASIQLGKALNDPVANLSALSRSGIQFSESQKQVIKDLAQSGQLAAAQGIILDELNNQYGGSAAAATAGAGAFQQLSNVFGDLKEDLGEIVVEFLNPFVKRLQTFVERIREASPEAKRFAVQIAAFAAAAGPALLIIGQLVKTAPLIGRAFTVATGPIGIVVAAVGAAAFAIIDNWDTIKEYFTNGDGSKTFSGLQEASQRLFDVMTRIWNAGVQLIQDIWTKYGDNIQAFTAFVVNQIVDRISFMFDVISTTFEVFSNLFSGNWSALWENLTTIFKRVINFIIDLFIGFVETIVLLYDKVATALGADSIYDTAVANIESFREAISFSIPIAEEAAEQNTALSKTFKKLAEDAKEAEDQLKKTNAVLGGESNNSADEDFRANPITPDGIGGGIIAQIAQYQLDLKEAGDASDEFTNNQLINWDSLAAAVGGFGDNFSRARDQGVSSLEALDKAIRATIRNVIGALAEQAAAAAVANFLTTSAAALGPLAIPLAAAAGATAKGLVQSFIPALAQGGITTGATLALIGDNPSGREAVIPFERMGEFLKQFQGGNNVNIRGEFVQRGEELIAVIDNTNKLNNITS